MRYNVDKVDYILDYLIMDYIWVNQIIVIFLNFYYGVYQSILLYLYINYNDVFFINIIYFLNIFINIIYFLEIMVNIFFKNINCCRIFQVWCYKEIIKICVMLESYKMIL